MVLLDEPPVTMRQPGWAPDTAAELGAINDAAEAAGFTAALRGPQAEAVMGAVIGQMTTAALPDDDRKTIMEQLMRRESASALLFDHAAADWRDVLPRISVPTLVIGGEASMFPADAIRNTATAIPGSQIVIVPAAEGGSHMAFYENPRAVNEAIRVFLHGQKNREWPGTRH
jgi:non-heme chloroperoxidase